MARTRKATNNNKPSKVSKPRNNKSASTGPPAKKQARSKETKRKGKTGARDREEDEQEQDEQEQEMSEKKKGKRRRTDEESDDELARNGDGGHDSNQPHPKSTSKKHKPNMQILHASLVRNFKRVVPKKSFDKSWNTLSQAGQAVLRAQIDDATICSDLQPIVKWSRIDVILSETAVPPMAGRKSTKAGEAEIASSEDLLKRIDLMETALDPELEEVRLLRAALAKEQEALEEDEARLVTFESKRRKVELIEAKEAGKNRAGVGLDAILASKGPSSTWVSESASANHVDREGKKKEEDESQEEETGQYDPEKDDYLVQLSSKLDESLKEVEERLKSLRRVEKVVHEAERGLVGLK
ncbi:hypothetical protein T439DRAFT_331545 [Meredithblackwellia eburnea MCA 4105]